MKSLPLLMAGLVMAQAAPAPKPGDAATGKVEVVPSKLPPPPSLPPLARRVYFPLTKRLTAGDYVYFTNATGHAIITGFNTNHAGALSITNSLGGCPVTSIGEWAFDGCTSLTDVIIPAGVTNIEDRAFSSCPGLMTITVDAANGNYSSSNGVLFNKDQTRLIEYPNGRNGDYGISPGVTMIGSFAFTGCQNVTKITIPASVTSIGWNPFWRCNGLTAISVDAANRNYKSVDGVLFNKEQTTLIRCPSGKAGSYTVPGSVTTIGVFAFSGCQGLTNVIISDSVKSIGTAAFQDCTKLPDSIRSRAPASVPQPPRQASPTPRTLLPGFRGGPRSGDRQIFPPPRMRLNAGDYTYFTNATGQASIAGFNKDCSGALSITNNLGGCPVTSIGDAAFQNCSRLTNITIPSSITSIGTRAFQNCGGLTGLTIPNSITNISEAAFEYCHGLTNVTIPASVASMAANPFGGCNGLLSIAVDGANPAFINSADGVLFDKEKTQLLAYPAAKTGGYAIPDGVVSIGRGAFLSSRLTSVTIPSSITSIGVRAFQNCGGLTGLTIPNSITNISEAAFEYCHGLTNVTIPASVTSMGGNPFGGCNGLLSIAVDGANPAFINSADGVLFDKEKTQLLACPTAKTGNYTIPDGVVSMGRGAFLCSKLTSVTIPNSVTSIGNLVFAWCPNLTHVTIPNSVTSIGPQAFDGCPKLTSVTIPDSVTSISGWAFQGCTGLTNLTLPASLTRIGTDAFRNCTNLPASIQTRIAAASSRSRGATATPQISRRQTIVRLKQMLTTTADPVAKQRTQNLLGLLERAEAQDAATSTSGNYTYFTNATRQAIIIKFDRDHSGALSITNTLGGCPVISIENSAFYRCTGLTRVTIPASVTNIGASTVSQPGSPGVPSFGSVGISRGRVFRYCLGLTAIAVDAANPNYSSADGVLFNKDQTTLVEYPCGKGGSYPVPSSVTNIGPYAFAYCAGLTSITIPKSITSIGNSAFYGCNGLTNVTIPAGFTNIGYNAFSGCTGLTNAFFKTYGGGDRGDARRASRLQTIERLKQILEKTTDPASKERTQSYITMLERANEQDDKTDTGGTPPPTRVTPTPPNAGTNVAKAIRGPDGKWVIQFPNGRSYDMEGYIARHGGVKGSIEHIKELMAKETDPQRLAYRKEQLKVLEAMQAAGMK